VVRVEREEGSVPLERLIGPAELVLGEGAEAPQELRLLLRGPGCGQAPLEDLLEVGPALLPLQQARQGIEGGDVRGDLIEDGAEGGDGRLVILEAVFVDL
jgi:hypothetical protein